VGIAQTVLLTGAAGFIGYHVAQRLLALGHRVAGIDNLKPYNPVELKLARLKQLRALPGFVFHDLDIANRTSLEQCFEQHAPKVVINLAAQVGVRNSLDNPSSYIDTNLVGFGNILEACRRHSIEHLLYASSSSVYGANTSIPFSESHNVDHPLSMYAATKKANELLAHSYSHLFRLPMTGLRFFTVYGPWGRPDMAVYTFTRAIMQGTPLDVYNHGDMKRDFTYVDDIVEAIVRLISVAPTPDSRWQGATPDPATSNAPYRVYNIGNSEPVELMTMIRCLEKHTGKTANLRLLPMQPGDVPVTFADTAHLEQAIGFRPSTSLDEGLRKFVEWYRMYHLAETRPARIGL
jgi:UDP-glucuronate 4-epimerase